MPQDRFLELEVHRGRLSSATETGGVARPSQAKTVATHALLSTRYGSP
jgi:hypothetical protein